MSRTAEILPQKRNFYPSSPNIRSSPLASALTPGTFHEFQSAAGPAVVFVVDPGG
ncbi:hypothetical protein [Arthrobacter sp. Z1-15]